VPETRTSHLLPEVSTSTQEEYDREFEEWFAQVQEETEREVAEEIARSVDGRTETVTLEDPIIAPEPIAVTVRDGSNITSIPAHYAHFGKRRRRFTEEMVRCPLHGVHLEMALDKDPDRGTLTNTIEAKIQCNKLLWVNRPEELRAHLIEHLSEKEVDSLSDDEVRSRFIEAKRSWLPVEDDDIEDDED
jgi:hypothetical protein